MLVRALATKNRKGSARDVLNTFATLSGLVYDVTDTGHKMAALTVAFSRLSNDD